MYLNLIGLGFIGLCLSYLVYQFFRPTKKEEKHERSGLLVAQDTGKSKQIQSKTGDASMQVELRRRRAIQAIGRIDHTRIKESTYQKGSTTGALETFFITGICPPLARIIENLLYDGGGACDDYCSVLEDTGSGPGYDAGNSKTENCKVICEENVLFDAGEAINEYCNVLEDLGNGPGYDAGNSNSESCNPIGKLLDAGGASNDYCEVLEDVGSGGAYDAGNANTTVCGN